MVASLPMLIGIWRRATITAPPPGFAATTGKRIWIRHEPPILVHNSINAKDGTTKHGVEFMAYATNLVSLRQRQVIFLNVLILTLDDVYDTEIQPEPMEPWLAALGIGEWT